MSDHIIWMALSKTPCLDVKTWGWLAYRGSTFHMEQGIDLTPYISWGNMIMMLHMLG